MEYQQLKIHNLQHNKTLGEVLKENGVSINEFENYWEIANNELIGEGSNGKVFDIGNNSVLKISRDENEYDTIKLLLNEIEIGNNWFVDIINLPICICPVNENFNINGKIQKRYYFILDKLFKLNDKQYKTFKIILQYFDSIGFSSIILRDNDKEKLQEYMNTFFKNYYDDSIINFVINMIKLCNEYYLNDLHIDNIMTNYEGKFKIIDLRS